MQYAFAEPHLRLTCGHAAGSAVAGCQCAALLGPLPLLVLRLGGRSCLLSLALAAPGCACSMLVAWSEGIALSTMLQPTSAHEPCAWGSWKLPSACETCKLLSHCVQGREQQLKHLIQMAGLVMRCTAYSCPEYPSAASVFGLPLTAAG